MSDDWPDLPGEWHGDDAGHSDEAGDGEGTLGAHPDDLTGPGPDSVDVGSDGDAWSQPGDDADYSDAHVPFDASHGDLFAPDHPIGEPAIDDGSGDVEIDAPQFSPDPWGQVIGVGAVDPTGAQPTVFGAIDLDPSIAPDSESSWLAGSGYLDVEGWVLPDLADGVPVGNTVVDSAGHESAGPAAVTALWQRLAPGVEMPTTAAGAPDLGGALDALAARAASPALLDVVAVARQQLGG
jgi:hypothetical protein